MALANSTVVERKGRNASADSTNIPDEIRFPAESAHLSNPSTGFDPGAFLRRVSTEKSSHEYQAEETIFSQGDAADAVFWIESGRVKLTVVSVEGKAAVLAIHPARSFFGESCLAGRDRRVATAVALEPTRIVRIPRQAMINLLQHELEFAGGFIEYLLTRDVFVEKELMDQLLDSSEKRLARLLLRMAGFGGEDKPLVALEKISQETLAEMIGTTRSRVNFFLNRFRKLGFIHYNGGLHVHRSLFHVVFRD